MQSTRIIVISCLYGVTLLHAGLITETIGTQHYTDGQVLGTGTYNTGVAGNPAPFNHFNGSDVSGPSFSASWSYSYTSLADPVTSAILTIGMYDTDAQAPGNQVASFIVDGSTDLTSALNTAFEAHGGANGEYDVYTITLPSSEYATLQAGTPSFSLALQGPGLGALGQTSFNGAGLDFSTLSLTTQAPVTTPEPEPGMLVAAALGLGLYLGYRRHARC